MPDIPFPFEMGILHVIQISMNSTDYFGGFFDRIFRVPRRPSFVRRDGSGVFLRMIYSHHEFGGLLMTGF
jgi:hypothetical protein